MAKILVVEDNQELVGMLKTLLESDHHNVEVLMDGQEAEYTLKINKFDAIILDWELPGKTGIELCRQFRASGGTTPILILTGRREIDDKESGLDSGADDYLTKPFHPRELQARMRSLLRRSASQNDNTLTVLDLMLIPSDFTACRGERSLKLQPKEFALLEFLLRNRDKVFSQEALLERVWQSDTEATAEAVRSTMKRLRKKVDQEGEIKLIHTVHGVGFILKTTSD